MLYRGRKETPNEKAGCPRPGRDDRRVGGPGLSRLPRPQQAVRLQPQPRAVPGVRVRDGRPLVQDHGPADRLRRRLRQMHAGAVTRRTDGAPGLGGPGRRGRGKGGTG
ncbi:MAG: hypothetical protein MZV64_10600 [Ignavibacteriales bacterium]|nr:hypothetical protein [Ignavibacteriales bacterium]